VAKNLEPRRKFVSGKPVHDVLAVEGFAVIGTIVVDVVDSKKAVLTFTAASAFRNFS